MGTPPKADNKKKEVGGIKNIGNTCYMGVALQALTIVTALSNFVLQNVKRLPEIPLVKEYVQMIKTILKLRKPADPKELKVTVSRKSPLFADFAQHDSQEFIQFFVNALHESLMGILRGVAQGVSCDMYRNDGAGAASAGAAQHDQIWRDAIDHWRNEVLAPKKGSVIFDLFAGQSVSELKCLTEERLRDIPLDKLDICCFMRLFKDKDENGEGDRLICISLAQRFTGEKVYLVDAPDAGQLPFDVPLISINHCLADFVKPENIEGSRCEKCSNATPPPPAPRTLVKQLSFMRLPDILIICFKRFIDEPFDHRYIKQSVPVSFPLDNEDGHGDRLICISLAQRFTDESHYIEGESDTGQLPNDVPLISINHCLADFIKPEDIEGSRCEKCSNATPPPSAPRTLVKQLMFTRLPDILIVCFKRFIYEPFERLYIKQHVPVSFPLDKSARRNRFSASTFFSPAAFHLVLFFSLFCVACPFELTEKESLMEARIKENLQGTSMNLLVAAVTILLGALALGITFSSTILPIGRNIWNNEREIKNLKTESKRMEKDLIQLRKDHDNLIIAFAKFKTTVMRDLVETAV